MLAGTLASIGRLHSMAKVFNIGSAREAYEMFRDRTGRGRVVLALRADDGIRTEET